MLTLVFWLLGLESWLSESALEPEQRADESISSRVNDERRLKQQPVLGVCSVRRQGSPYKYMYWFARTLSGALGARYSAIPAPYTYLSPTPPKFARSGNTVVNCDAFRPIHAPTPAVICVTDVLGIQIP